MPRIAVGPGQASRIMTGAPHPRRAPTPSSSSNARRMLDGARVRLEDRPKPGQHILRRGAEMRAGEVVLRAGAVLRPQELGMLAMVGRASVRLMPRPRVAVAATGDELVEPPALPGPGQIRNSNAPMLLAQAARAGGRAALPGHRPRPASTACVPLIRRGVADGRRAGPVRRRLGGQARPGARRAAGAGRDGALPQGPTQAGQAVLLRHARVGRGQALVFGLPGNPVSSLVCFELFVRPALRRLAGHAGRAAADADASAGGLQLQERPADVPPGAASRATACGRCRGAARRTCGRS